MNVVVTGNDRAAVDALADELAEAAWRDAHARRVVDPARRGRAAGEGQPVRWSSPTSPTIRAAAASGKTMWLLRASSTHSDTAPGTVIGRILNDALLPPTTCRPARARC